MEKNIAGCVCGEQNYCPVHQSVTRIDELRQQLEVSQIHNEKQLIEISRLRKALKFYTDVEIYIDDIPAMQGAKPRILLDRGERARKALEVMRNDRRT